MSEDLTQPVNVTLSRADVLILGVALDKLGERLLKENEDNKPLVQALWNLDAALERVDDDAFRADHGKLLAQARNLYRGYFDV
ncbi:hypothetical protein [uncultured Pelagimonas sp.]|uniref:hypothetical protein n=1 Tax=uncultured Pelagimonas sp. TaxID=1618102 RepID=UPI00260D50A6|nr:hypothetical protein [uncultured Pelagimonas sp.]